MTTMSTERPPLAAEVGAERERADSRNQVAASFQVYSYPRAILFQPSRGMGEVEQTIRAFPDRVRPNLARGRGTGQYTHLRDGRPG